VLAQVKREPDTMLNPLAASTVLNVITVAVFAAAV
jgi:hypothetical protein